jgi:hypothetical protein
MKKITILFLSLVLIVGGCKQKELQEIARLNLMLDSLENETAAKDSSISGILTSLSEIEQNLKLIKEKEAQISVQTASDGKINPDVRERINQDIQQINELMAKNKKTMAWLRKLLKDSNLKIAEFETLVEQQNASMKEKDTEIAYLKEDLTKLNFSIDILNANIEGLVEERDVLAENLDQRTNALHTAYYIKGTRKELLEEKVITKEGGFIGINAANKLSQDVNPELFTEVDITKLNEIETDSKKVELVTAHPKDSYQLATNEQGIIEKITITKPDKFWSASKYLVMVLN